MLSLETARNLQLSSMREMSRYAHVVQHDSLRMSCKRFFSYHGTFTMPEGCAPGVALVLSGQHVYARNKV